MSAETVEKEGKVKSNKPAQIKFTCQWCGKRKPLEDMVRVARFLPVLVVCRDCAAEMR